MKLKLDDRDAAILLSGLHAHHVSTCDAIAARAGKPYGYSRPRLEPTEIASCVDTLDRIERMTRDLGSPLNRGRRRDDVIRFWHEQNDIWAAEQMLASRNFVEV